MVRRPETPHGRRSGFTLPELLVVFALIAVVIALLASAIWKVRQSASRVECANNLQRMGGGIQRHHNQFGWMPSGGTHFPESSSHAPHDRPELWTWAYQILPFVDQKSLHDTRDYNRVARAPLPLYYCPARRSAEDQSEARIDYAGCAGTRAKDGLDGVIVRTGYGRVTLMRDLPEGTAQTIAIAEKQMNLDQLGNSADDNECYATSGWKDSFGTYRLGLEPPARDYRSPSLEPSRRFGSAHASGINALFADGSVRQIRYSVDADVFRRACLRDDNLSFSLNDP